MIKIPQLFLINPDGTTTEITDEKPIKDVLKTDECYVLVADEVRKVYLWKGLKSSVRSKFIGAKRSQEIRDQVGMHYGVVPVDEGDEKIDFIKLIGGQTEPGIAKEIKKLEVSIPNEHQLKSMNIVGSRGPEALNIGPSYRAEGSADHLLETLEPNAPINLIIELQEKVNKQRSIINELKKEIEDRQKGAATPISEMPLSNKDRILNLLKSKNLTSKQIAEKLHLSKQDTRTYLLRLKKENKIKILGKKGRYYVYTYKVPLDTAILSFKEEISKKISELEAKVNILAAKPTIFPEEEEFFELGKASISTEIEDKPSIFKTPSSQMLELTITQLDGTLQTLLAVIPEVKAATIVSTEGKPIVSALPQDVDDSRIASMLAPLFSLAQKAIIEMNQGEFDQLYVKGSDGYLLVLAAGPNAVLAVSTTKDVRLGLIFLDCKRTCEKIAKLI